LVESKTGLSKGLCPFHPDHNPSLAVYPDHFYCFGCGAHGDVIDWVMKLHNLSFNEALKYLTEKFNLPPTTTTKSKAVATKRRRRRVRRKR